MATYAPLPAQTLPNSGGQISIYGHPSPTNSNTNTPANGSPTSPHLSSATVLFPAQSRQIRPPKAPLYVPAVLRPTERPSRPQTATATADRDPSPITPPRSVHGSLDSLSEDASPVEFPGNFHLKHTVSKVAEDEWKKGERLGEVTGVPTRDHWKADSAAHTCDSPTCRSSFGIFTRRHHCRHCGHVFCSGHTPYVVPLDQNARFHPEGSASRACDQCYKAYQRWEANRAAGMNRIQQKLDARHIDAQIEHEEQVDDAAEVPHRQTEFTVASSVPRDWNWSTF